MKEAPAAVEKPVDLDDEWLGGSTESLAAEVEEDQEVKLEDNSPLIGSDIEEEEDEAPAYQQKSIVVPQDPLNEPGTFDQGLQALNTFFDPASIGMNIDGNHLSSVMINNTKGVKTLISYEHQLEKSSGEVTKPETINTIKETMSFLAIT